MKKKPLIVLPLVLPIIYLPHLPHISLLFFFIKRVVLDFFGNE